MTAPDLDAIRARQNDIEVLPNGGLRVNGEFWNVLKQCKVDNGALLQALADAQERERKFRDALEPFASFARRIDALKPEKGVPVKPADERGVHVSVGMDFATDYTFGTFRNAARALLAETEAGNGSSK